MESAAENGAGPRRAGAEDILRALRAAETAADDRGIGERGANTVPRFLWYFAEF